MSLPSLSPSLSRSTAAPIRAVENPPPPACWGVSVPNRGKILTPRVTPSKSSDPLDHPPNSCRENPPWPHQISFFTFWQSSKDQCFRKPPKICKIEPDVAQDYDLESFGLTLGTPFVFSKRKNFVFAQEYNPRTSFRPPET